MVESFGQYYEMEPSFVAVTTKVDVWEQLPDSDPDKAICRQFVELFQAEYGQPPAMWAVLGAQMLSFLEDGLRRAEADPTKVEAARSQLRDALENTEDLQLYSGVYTMSPENHYGATRQMLTLVTFKDGQWVYLP
jgi:branched-chain amino acid transport system substrate-binding protein